MDYVRRRFNHVYTGWHPEAAIAFLLESGLYTVSKLFLEIRG